MLQKLLAGQHYSNSALYIDTLPPLSTFTGLWIIALTFKEILTSIVIIREERTISAFLMLKETMENKDFYTYVQKNGIPSTQFNLDWQKLEFYSR